jgi:hypothetical protein
MSAILLVGEQNPHNADPMLALWPDPPYGSGGRLAKILGLSTTELILHDRVNLCYDAWDVAEARVSAQSLLERRAAGTGFVLLGRKAEDVFGWVYPRYEVRYIHPYYMLSLPHPSGLCREWNDPHNVVKARLAWADLRRLVERA